ncbi:UPF0415 protein C7orf25 homolog [Contarinia nasturtii]|uniref:UPF0415 protein C7orf25 homolog n=1 Tax=Contarinia nasturtii TaxID=265458 RepID=UPI0012D3C0C4|nr:UPF0415 protein C7orf25 homolog [Contarinia nasturtii]
MELDQVEIDKLGEKKICVGIDLIQQLNCLDHIQGIGKIRKKISTEISTLQNTLILKRLTINNIICSNLIHFAYLVKILNKTENVQGVDFPIKIHGSPKASIRIDIVTDNGKTWIKVIARNPIALCDIAFGRSNYGSKSVIDHANNYIEAARENPQCFQIPKIIFDFANQIDEELKSSLENLNIIVRIDGSSRNEISQSVDTISKLNLDVTAMMAFVSSLTCESSMWEFNQPILSEQAQAERRSSTKAFLDKVFEGKELIACTTAKESFLRILSVVGGPNEQKRAKKFLRSITILHDLNEDEEEFLWSSQKSRLCLAKKIQNRTYKIFSFGMYHKAFTVTANKSAIEAAKMQGLSIPAIIHEARALTEQKQYTAKKV